VGMPEPTAAGVRDLVRMMRANTYNATRTWLFYPLRIFGWRRPRPPADGPGSPDDAPGASA
jgi:hypothetical protein